MKPLVVIPARSGSKGLPGKNIRPLNGKPLIHYTIEVARSLFPDERICVSTDAQDIKACAEDTGLVVPFLRPAALATDTAGTEGVLLHAMDHYNQVGLDFDMVVLLQVTSPLRTARHIEEAMELYSNDLDMVVSVKHTDANPYYVLKEEDEAGYLQASKEGTFSRRQDCPDVYELNGAIYLINRRSLVEKGMAAFSKTRKFVMDKPSSIDIDDEIDFRLAEILL